MTPEIPNLFYTVVGILVVGNLANIVSLFVFLFKAGRFIERIEAGLQSAEAKGNRAHKRIDKEIEDRLHSIEKHESRYHPI